MKRVQITTHQRRATIIGILFITPFCSYGGGNALIEAVLKQPDALANLTAHQWQYGVGALLMLINSLNVAALGMLLYPVLAEHSTVIAHGYAATRIAEAVLLGVGVGCLLCILPAGNNSGGLPNTDLHSAHSAMSGIFLQTSYTANVWFFRIGMIALSVGSVGMCWILWRSRLIPAILAWGLLAGYVLLGVGCVVEIFGYTASVVCAVPGGIMEVAFGAWLMVKGFYHQSSV